nr:hypothetical protein [Altererythrobacter segetis]
MATRKTVAAWVLVFTVGVIIAFFILPMIYGFLIWTGWIGR